MSVLMRHPLEMGMIWLSLHETPVLFIAMILIEEEHGCKLA